MSRALMDTTQVMEVWDKPVQAPKAAAADEAVAKRSESNKASGTQLS